MVFTLLRAAFLVSSLSGESYIRAGATSGPRNIVQRSIPMSRPAADAKPAAVLTAEMVLRTAKPCAVRARSR